MVIFLAVLAYIVSVVGAVVALSDDDKTIALILMWLFGGICIFLVSGATTVATVLGVISFLVAIIVGLVGLFQKDGTAILVAISFLAAALILMQRILFW